MKKILLDTNILLAPFRLKIDIFDEISRIIDEKYELYTLDRCVDELKFIMKSNKKLKERINAKLALSLIDKKGIRIIETRSLKGPTDRIIMDIAKKYNMVVATGDLKLKKNLLKNGIDVIYIRQKKYLDLQRA